MPKKTFDERCYEVVRNIPNGRVMTYKQIGEEIKSKAYRAIGQAMKRSPGMPKVPCHRVVCSNGKVGGFNRGTKEKIKLLRKEGIGIKRGRVLGFREKLSLFKKYHKA